MSAEVTTARPGSETNTAPRHYPVTFEGFGIGPEFRFSRGHKMTPAAKKRARQFCVAADTQPDGKFKCGIGGEVLDDPLRADLDHINENPTDHRAENLRLVCHSHNAQRWNQVLANRVVASSSTQLERKKQGAGAGMRLAASTEEQILFLSRRNEKAFRAFYFERILEDRRNGRVKSPESLRVMARNYTGCSKSSSYSYAERLFAENGPLRIDRDMVSGEVFVTFREPSCYAMSLPTIEKKYPAEGFLSLNEGD
jgi:hypothetical protein